MRLRQLNGRSLDGNPSQSIITETLKGHTQFIDTLLHYQTYAWP